MFYLFAQKKRKNRNFVQEYAYIEDYSLFYNPEEQKEKKKRECPRGAAEVDLDNGKTVEIEIA